MRVLLAETLRGRMLPCGASSDSTHFLQLASTRWTGRPQRLRQQQEVPRFSLGNIHYRLPWFLEQTRVFMFWCRARRCTRADLTNTLQCLSPMPWVRVQHADHFSPNFIRGTRPNYGAENESIWGYSFLKTMQEGRPCALLDFSSPLPFLVDVLHPFFYVRW